MPKPTDHIFHLKGSSLLWNADKVFPISSFVRLLLLNIKKLIRVLTYYKISKNKAIEFIKGLFCIYCEFIEINNIHRPYKT